MSSANYLTTVAPLQITQTTLAAEPSINGSITFTNRSGTSVRVIDIPTGYHFNILVVFDTSDPVAWTPSDQTDYANGTTVSGTKKVFNITAGGYYDLTGLTANTTYYFRVYPYNGSGLSANYRTETSGVFSVVTTASAPTVQASNFHSYAEGSNVIASTIVANSPAAEGYVIYRKAGSYPTNTPSDGTEPTVNTTSTTNDVCIYDGPAGSPAISRAASKAVTYYYRCYAYNGDGADRKYNLTSPNQSICTEGEMV